MRPPPHRVYERAAAHCRTVNQLHRLHVELASRMTPAEAFSLHDEWLQRPGWNSPARFFPTKLLAMGRQRMPWLLRFRGLRDEVPYEQRRWMLRLGRMCRAGGRHEPQPYERSRLGRDVSRFGTGGTAAHKTLALCFTGSSNRLLMPIAAFLQHLDADAVDVVLVRYPKRAGFCAGMPGHGTSFEDTVATLARLTRPCAYARAVSLGTSGGGLAALLAAAQLGFDAAVSVSGKGPDEPRWAAALGGSVGDALQRRLDACRAPPRLHLVFGREHERDKAHARAWAARLPVNALEIADPDRPVGHNALRSPLLRGELSGLLATTLLGRAA